MAYFSPRTPFFCVLNISITNVAAESSLSVAVALFNTANAINNELAAATFVILIFTTQKNGVRGEK